MLNDRPLDWTFERVAAPADAPLMPADARLDQVVRAVVTALACDAAALYRRDGASYCLVAGQGAVHVAAERFDAVFGTEDEDFAQPPRGDLAAQALFDMGQADPVRFAAAARVDRGRAVLVAWCRGAHTPLSAAESYVLRAYAGQAATAFELAAVQRSSARRGGHCNEERLRLLESVALHARDSIVITQAAPVDEPGPRILFCNRAFTQTTGYSADEVIGRSPRMLQGAGTDPAARAKLRAALVQWQAVTVELLNYRKDGTPFWVELSIVPVSDDTGWYTHWVSVQRDVTERRQADELSRRMRIAEVQNQALATEIGERKRIEEELRYTAFHDNLTRLNNRAFFMRELGDALSRDNGARDDAPRADTPRAATPRVDTGADTPPSATPASCCAVLFVDLDRFKVVNDSLGHEAGDQLLVEVADRLRACARPGDVLARLGGDEFALLIRDATDTALPIAVARRMLDALRPPVRIGRQEVFPSCSVGIALSSPRALLPETLIRDADIAMYVAKRSGNGEYAVYDDSMHADATAALSLQTDLQNAMEHGEFALAFQPIVDPQTGRICKFEALIRWHHPQRGAVQPSEFVPMAEEIGLIRQIDRWVLREACQQLGRWRAQFPAMDLGMSVNASARELNDPDFVPHMVAVLAEFGVPPHALEIEITETIFLDPDPRIAQIIAAVRAHGVRVGLDDFGTGYSSLSYLNRYPTDTIKIDRSFVESLCSDDRTLAIVLLIIQLASTLGVAVVAEGVETEEQAELLASMSCSFAQGYYFSRPLTAAAATATLARSSVISRG